MAEIDETELAALQEKARFWDMVKPRLDELNGMIASGELTAIAGEPLVDVAIREIRLLRADQEPIAAGTVAFDTVAMTGFSLMMNEIRQNAKTGIGIHHVRFAAYCKGLEAILPTLIGAGRAQALQTVCNSISGRCATIQGGVDAAAIAQKRENVIAGVGQIEALTQLSKSIELLAGGVAMTTIPPADPKNSLN